MKGMKIKITIFTILIISMFVISLSAGEPTVYSNDDLEKYTTGQEEETWQYNQQISGRQRSISEYEDKKKAYENQQKELERELASQHRKSIEQQSQVEETKPSNELKRKRTKPLLGVSGGAINTETGQYNPDVGGGYVNPQNGQFVPKR
ncbi:MAG: hypothetical protein L6290_05545 [Thermodesulfovibrionales bacterium]|nr:hypothetical protein [Thermodesulfovibrionales bacterium]